MKRTLSTLIFLAACTSDAPKTAEDSAEANRAAAESTVAAARAATVPPGEQPSTPAPAAPSTDEPAAAEWQVTSSGIGSLKAGMSLDEAKIVMRNDIVVPAKLEECAMLTVKNAPGKVLVMVEKGVVTRIDVTSGTIATIEGAKIGDTEAQIKSLYPGVQTQPHKYTDGHYLVVTPKSGGNNRIVFETDGNKVLRYRSGQLPSVEYVEGCS